MEDIVFMKEQYSEMTELGLKLHTYLVKVMRNAARNYDKKEKYLRTKTVNLTSEVIDNQDSIAAEKSYSEQIENIELKFALDSLPNELKEIITLYYIDGLSNAEIEKKVGLSEVTIIKRKTEAIKLLRERLSSV